jgi:L,D-transpeptidase YcbB
MVHAFRRRSAAVLLILAAVAPAPALARDAAWSKEDVEALLRIVESADEEGLDPQDYAKQFLHEAVLRDVPPSSTLNEIALRLASDFRYGRVPKADRVDWETETVDPSLLAQIISQAVAENRIEEAFHRLLPQHEQYKALRRALAETSDAKRRTTLRVNMERWRWMPRNLGAKHLFVNIPSYRVDLVEDGAVVAEHAAIVGKPSTPTAAFSTMVTAIRFNPAWAVPPGLKAQKLRFYKRNPTAAKRMGYSVSYGPDGPTIWQRPGPGNALGQVRFVMPNPYLIYLHDTPEKDLFSRNARALSQGCVRTKQPVELAARLLRDDGTDPAMVETALAERATQEISLNEPVPVHIAYLTAEADAGGAVKLLPDIYGRDARVARALDGGTQIAAK